MLMLTCPSCKKSDRVPDKFLGMRLKCKACGTSILVTAQGAEAVPAHPVAAVAAATAPAPAPASAAKATAAPAPSGIEVEGLDQTLWTAVSDHAVPTVAPPAAAGAPSPAATNGDGHHAPGKEYKLLTQKDKWFEGKFDLSRLEEALNAYARQGWVVKSMATPHIAGFSGGPREELVVLLER